MLINLNRNHFDIEVNLPLSKSESNRALMIHFYRNLELCNSKTLECCDTVAKDSNNSATRRLGDLVTSLSTSDDTILLENLLNKISQYVKNYEQGLLSVDSCPLTLDCANAGTVFRFLMTAVAMQFTIYNEQLTIDGEQLTIDNGQRTNTLSFSASQSLSFLLTGSDRMKQRPIDSLVEALRSLGVTIEYTEKEGYPPVLIKSTTDDTDSHRLYHRQKDTCDTRDAWSDIINSSTDDTDSHRLYHRQKDTCDTRDAWSDIINSSTDDTDSHRLYHRQKDTCDIRDAWRLEISAEQSSQFASSLLLAAPLFDNGLELHLTGNISSLPYIDMTINMMRQCGIDVVRNERDIIVKHGIYNIENLTIEPDWSAAAFWYEIVALSDNAEVLLKNLNINSLQADSVAAKMFENLGVETIAIKDGIIIKKSTAKSLISTVLVQQPTATFNFQDCPDLFPAVIATCAGLCVDSTFTGLKNLSIKESDRKKAMMNELRKINISFEDTSDDILRMSCPKELPYFTEENPINFNNYGDHRIAMALSILSMKIGAISMENTEVVSKSYPGFFEEFTINN